MKTLLLLGCAFCLGACGDGGNGTGTYQAPGQLGNQSQPPQAPSDSVPATNTQSPTLNDQTPLVNSQSPSSITCSQAFAALRAAGCNIGQNDQAQCEAALVPGAPCLNELQALFRCYLTDVVCDDSGHVIDASICDNETTAVDTCESAHSQSPPPANPGGCTSANNCNCSTSCESCRCQAIDNPSLSSTCDTNCSVTN